MIVRLINHEEGGRSAYVWCPGCEMLHSPQIIGEDGREPTPCWDWNGSLESPTFNPSLLCYHTAKPAACTEKHPHWLECPNPDSCGASGHLVVDNTIRAHVQPCPHGPNGNCHSFIRDGMWQFLADSGHALAGQTVPMVPLPDWFAQK